MEHQEQSPTTDKILAFDTLFTTNQIKMYKILLFFLDAPMQKLLAVYIKFLELQYTLSYFKTHLSVGVARPDFTEICKEITPYCGPEEKKKIEQFARMQQMMENFKQVSETMEMMKELFPDETPMSGFDFNSDFFKGNQNDSSQLFEILSSMMGDNKF